MSLSHPEQLNATETMASKKTKTSAASAPDDNDTDDENVAAVADGDFSYDKEVVNKKLMKEFVYKHLANVQKDAFDPIYNAEDPEFTYILLKAAIQLAKADGAKTLMSKHTQMIVGAYNQLADDLNSSPPARVTKKWMREHARSRQDSKKVAQKAIDVIYNKVDDKLITMAKWNMTLLLSASKQTVMEKHATSALDVYDTLKTALNIVEDDNEAADTVDMRTD